MKSLLTPGICLLAVAAALHYSPLVPSLVLLGYVFYAALSVGLLLAWRFHSSRTFLALLLVFLSQQAITFYSAGHISARGPGATALVAIGVLLPLDFTLISFQQEKGFGLATIAPSALLLFLESVIVAVLCRADPLAAGSRHIHAHALAPAPLPFATLLSAAIAAGVLLVRFLLFRKPIEGGLLWALAACMLALRFGGIGLIPTAYFASAACLLAAAMVESSYLLAYQDELTALPSRRAFQENLLRIQPPYSIAMLDIDHFKRCNDTYGHDTGDQVLRLVAGRLARVTGGGRAYRCCGGEFAVVFPGKTASEVMDPLETLRASIERSSFHLRGGDRRRTDRGPDRRGPASIPRRKASTKSSVTSPSIEISVTASIGVAASNTKNSTPEEVIRAADKALYRAKAGGRNRIECDAAKNRRLRTKTAGIA
jgi:GGDEF domain-containing protein